MVDINCFSGIHMKLGNLVGDINHSLEHGLPVLVGIRLAPLHVVQVGLSLLGVNPQVVQIIRAWVLG